MLCMQSGLTAGTDWMSDGTEWKKDCLMMIVAKDISSSTKEIIEINKGNIEIINVNYSDQQQKSFKSKWYSTP